MASVGSIIGGGFRLIMERPAAVAVWAVIYAVFSLGAQMLMLQQMGGLAPDPEAIQSGAVNPFGIIGMAIPIWIASLLFYSVMMCAAFRAVLRPSERSFASLRLGMDELRMVGLFLILIIAFMVLGVIAMLLLGVVVGGMVVATGGGAGGVIASVVLWLACLCGMIFLWVRLSLIFPLSFVRRRIAIDGAWSLTRGHFWTLFLAYLVIFIISFVLTMMVIMPFMSPYFAQLAEAFRNPEAMRTLQEDQMRRQLETPFATLALTTVLSSVVSAVTLALGAGASATATRELLLEDGEVLEDDAEDTAAIFE